MIFFISSLILCPRTSQFLLRFFSFSKLSSNQISRSDSWYQSIDSATTMVNHSTENSKLNQKQTRINKETQQWIQTESEVGSSCGSYKLSDGVKAELSRMNTNVENLLGCFYRLLHDRGKELDCSFNGGFDELGEIRIREHGGVIENQEFQSEFDFQFQEDSSMESGEASHHPYMVDLIRNGDSEASRQQTNNGSEILEAKIQAMWNLVNRSPIGDEGMRNCDSFATCDDILEKFHDLKQDCAVDEYLLRFEKLKNEILATGNWSFTEEFLVQKFTNGLKHEIRRTLDIFGPLTLLEAINLARLQEGYLGMTTSNGGDISVTVELVTESPEKLPAVLVKKVEKPFEIQTEFHGDIGTLDVQLSGCEVNGLKSNIEHANFGENMAVVETEDVVVETEVILVVEEPAIAIDCGVVQNPGKEVPKEIGDESCDVENEEVKMSENVVANAIIGTEMSKNGLLQIIFNDPFYKAIKSVLVNDKMHMMLAVRIAISMVEVKGWLAFECEACRLVLRSQGMCAAAGIGAQWLRRGVG